MKTRLLIAAVAILTIMEMGDLQELLRAKMYEKAVAILTIMEMGDLLKITVFVIVNI